MSDLIVRILDLETNELTEREINADELAVLELDKAEAQSKAQAEAEAMAAKAALLDRLGITADEAKLLLS